MNTKTSAAIICILDELNATVSNYLLCDHSVTSISLNDLEIDKRFRRIISRYTLRINDLVNTFIINGDNLEIHAEALSKVKPYLQQQFVKLIAPPQYGGFASNDITFELFSKRYITHESYPTEMLQLFSQMADKLFTMPIKKPGEITENLLLRLSYYIRYTHFAWRKIISDLINHALTPGTSVTDVFKDRVHIYPYIEKMLEFFHIPFLLERQHNALLISSTFFENVETILPYLIPLIRSAYAPPTTLCRLLYSFIMEKEHITIPI